MTQRASPWWQLSPGERPAGLALPLPYLLENPAFSYVAIAQNFMLGNGAICRTVTIPKPYPQIFIF